MFLTVYLLYFSYGDIETQSSSSGGLHPRKIEPREQDREKILLIKRGKRVQYHDPHYKTLKDIVSEWSEEEDDELFWNKIKESDVKKGNKEKHKKENTGTKKTSTKKSEPKEDKAEKHRRREDNARRALKKMSTSEREAMVEELWREESSLMSKTAKSKSISQGIIDQQTTAEAEDDSEDLEIPMPQIGATKADERAPKKHGMKGTQADKTSAEEMPEKKKKRKAVPKKENEDEIPQRQPKHTTPHPILEMIGASPIPKLPKLRRRHSLP